MAFYLVTANINSSLIDQLRLKLEREEIQTISPFGEALAFALENAKYDPDTNRALWEEEDYCSPPLKEEKEQVLALYFDDIRTEKVKEGKGWKRIQQLPDLWDHFSSSTG